ncbi:hypothetical protein GCM10027174_04090 [Salinifilum aidingensis]
MLFTNRDDIVTGRKPFWHRRDTVTTEAEIDPEYARLRGHFPGSWKHLLEVKARFDAVSALDLGGAVDDQRYQALAKELMADAATFLKLAADVEPSSAQFASQCHDLADLLKTYATTGEWPDYDLHRAVPGQPWLFCGPLSTWDPRDVHVPLSFVVTVPHAAQQASIDAVTTQCDDLRHQASEVLGKDVVSIHDTPEMVATDLLLSGGEGAGGHKNFAHFFPLEAPHARPLRPDFTVVFVNIHRQRLQECSLPLHSAVLGEPIEMDIDRLTAASLMWFRSHDLAHFWRATGYSDRKQGDVLDDFEKMTLEETFADMVGFLSASVVADHEALSKVFTAELLRYLSREPSHFADSLAASLEAGWLRRSGIHYPSGSADVASIAKSFRELIPVLHESLWSDNAISTQPIVDAINEGRKIAQGWQAEFSKYPTDLDYVFG